MPPEVCGRKARCIATVSKSWPAVLLLAVGCSVLFPYFAEYALAPDPTRSRIPAGANLEFRDRNLLYSDDWLRMSSWLSATGWYVVEIENVMSRPIEVRWDGARIRHREEDERVTVWQLSGERVSKVSVIASGTSLRFRIVASDVPPGRDPSYGQVEPPFGIPGEGAQPGVGFRTKKAIGRTFDLLLPVVAEGERREIFIATKVADVRLTGYQ